MQRQPVISSNLVSVGYDPRTKTLEVEYHHSGVYRHFGIPEGVYTGLMNAASKGSYLDTFVKKAGYEYEQVG